MHVTVFGSNEDGFHGAGAAGLVMRGTSVNNWRSDSAFLLAMRSPVGSPHRIGQRAVFGIGRGFQTGHHGSSYAIATVTRPGLRRSISLTDIMGQLIAFIAFAALHPEMHFTILNIGTGYAGYSPQEMESLWSQITLPPNCVRTPRQDIALS